MDARRRILILPVFALAALVIGGCGDDDGPAMSTCGTVGPVVQILDNHPTGDHELTVPAADVVAGAERTYDIQGDNTGHAHSVTVTAADFLNLQEGTSVTLVSSNNGSVGASHTHSVVIGCP